MTPLTSLLMNSLVSNDGGAMFAEAFEHGVCPLTSSLSREKFKYHMLVVRLMEDAFLPVGNGSDIAGGPRPVYPNSNTT